MINTTSQRQKVHHLWNSLSLDRRGEARLEVRGDSVTNKGVQPPLGPLLECLGGVMLARVHSVGHTTGAGKRN